ncbi:MAG TPA: IS4 family transposase, partial [Isosphaeraceae bacterium]|nr:IS4 family transposase [Isosphaeraceae bacterium]
MTTWIDEELATLDLGDDLLNRRQKKVLQRFADRPHASIPGACQGWAETQGAYRFFSHPRVTTEAVLRPHHDATIRRIAEHPFVLLPQDTTELDFTRPQERVRGAGPLNWEQRLGFFQHVQLAVTPERLPLGVVAVTTWGRDPEDPHKNDRRKQMPIEQKESYRWLQGYRQACAVAAQVPSTQIISISDREGDIYECFVEAAEVSGPRADWIIRACQDRSLPERSEGTQAFDTLWETVAATTALGRLRVRLPRSGRGPAREATLTIRGARVDLRPPQRVGRKLPVVSVNAVLVREESPAPGVEPIEWLLLTNLPVETFEDACRVVSYYTCRWQMEVFFRVYKSGCRVEQIQLETEARLKPCLSLYLIVAWRVLYLTMLGRTCPDWPCDLVFAEEEWKSVWTIVRQEPAPAAPPSLNEMIGLVASLGGHLGRTKDGPPGPQVLWIGIQRMRDFAAAWQAFGPRP